VANHSAYDGAVSALAELRKLKVDDTAVLVITLLILNRGHGSVVGSYLVFVAFARLG